MTTAELRQAVDAARERANEVETLLTVAAERWVGARLRGEDMRLAEATLAAVGGEWEDARAALDKALSALTLQLAAEELARRRSA